jgi:hypothetical protein
MVSDTTAPPFTALFQIYYTTSLIEYLSVLQNAAVAPSDHLCQEEFPRRQGGKIYSEMECMYPVAGLSCWSSNPPMFLAADPNS